MDSFGVVEEPLEAQIARVVWWSADHDLGFVIGELSGSITLERVGQQLRSPIVGEIMQLEAIGDLIAIFPKASSPAVQPTGSGSYTFRRGFAVKPRHFLGTLKLDHYLPGERISLANSSFDRLEVTASFDDGARLDLSDTRFESGFSIVASPGLKCSLARASIRGIAEIQAAVRGKSPPASFDLALDGVTLQKDSVLTVRKVRGWLRANEVNMLDKAALRFEDINWDRPDGP